MINLKNRKIAVYGMGVSGLSALRLLKSLGAETIAINSGSVSSWAKSPGVLDYVSISNCYSEDDHHLPHVLQTVDLVILSPGIPREHELLEALHRRRIPVSGEIELAYRFLESIGKLKPIIGITGTNGKTTTTTFIGEMIEMDHKKVFVGGNIGTPFCDYAFELLNGGREVDFILLELSSFQLESIDHFHVNIAMILNLYQNHGERYTSIEDYGKSKFWITNNFTEHDVLIYPEDFPLIAEWARTQKGKKRTVNTKHPVSAYDLSKFKLPGIHNKVNLNFILEAAEFIGLSSSAIQKSIDTFAGVHHRIEYVDGLLDLPHFKVYNDAKSTNWDATLTAVKAMEGLGELSLIIGGKKRGHGDSILPYLDFLKEHVAFFYLIGEMADQIESEIKGRVDYQKSGTLETVISEVRRKKVSKDSVLLFSPGFPSFDQFKNYAQRGEHFMQLLRSKT